MVWLCLTAFACAKAADPLTEAQIVAQFEDLTCDFQSVMISHRPAVEHEYLEMLYKVGPLKLHIHKTYTAPAGFDPYDYQIMVTEAAWYDTRSMVRTPYASPLNDANQLWDEVERLTDFFDANMVDCQSLMELFLDLDDVQVRTRRTQITIEGVFDKPLPEDVEEVLQVIAIDEHVSEVHWIRRTKTPSTKQESSYILGTHYYFDVSQAPVFPLPSFFSTRDA